MPAVKKCQPLAKVIVKAGPHTRRECPLVFPLDPKLLKTKTPAALARVGICEHEREEECCHAWSEVFIDKDGQACVAMILDYLPARSERTYHLCRSPQARPVCCGVQVQNSAANKIVDVGVLGTWFTTYNYGREHARPHLAPVNGPFGASVTWGGPPDHKHHRSLWVAHGEVNGADNWSENPGHAKTVNEKIAVASGPALGLIRATNSWRTAQGKRLLAEQAEFVFYATAYEQRIVDVNVALTATEADVLFGDTKEGGTLSVRVAPSLEVEETGTLINSYGGVNEKEVWGKRAQWCDYSGLLEGRVAGIAVFDHPSNFRHPVWWHARNYGLMTANLFGLSHFTGDKDQRGDFTLRKGETLALRYRVLVHAGNACEANVAEKYHDFANPPAVEMSK